MTEIPRHTAIRFVEELDRLEKRKQDTPRPATSASPQEKTGARSGPSTRKAKAPSAPRPRRASRVKP
jgi:hypothetical protein